MNVNVLKDRKETKTLYRKMPLRMTHIDILRSFQPVKIFYTSDNSKIVIV